MFERIILIIVIHKPPQFQIQQFNSLTLNKQFQPSFLIVQLRLTKIRNYFKLVEVTIVILKSKNAVNVHLLLTLHSSYS